MNGLPIPDSIQIVYFSGSGGTQMAAEAFAAECAQRDIPHLLYAIDRSRIKGNPVLPFSPSSFTLLLYAVHALDAPAPVYDWIEGSTFPAGSKFGVFSVSGGGEIWPNTGCRSLVIQALEQKGCDVCMDDMLVMPSNMNPTGGDDVAVWLLRALPIKAKEIMDVVLSGNMRRTKYRLDPFRMFMVKSEKKNAHKFVETIRVQDFCTGCGWCAKNCPQNNIGMEGGRPVFNAYCVLCLRCVYGCPARALHTKHSIVIQAGFDLAAIQKRMAGREPKPFTECCRGLIWSGVLKYLKSAFPPENEDKQKAAL